MSEYFVNNKNILCKIGDISESYLSINGHSILCNNQILVNHKSKFLLKAPNEVGDGMDVFFMFKRSELLFDKLDLDAFKNGVTLYQEFDEELGIYKSYLYKFSKENLEDFIEIFDNLGTGLSISMDDKFVSIEGNYENIKTIISNLELWIENNSFHKLISFLFGLSMIYGDFDIHEDTIHGCKIYLPLAIYSNGFNDMFEKLMEFFEKNGFFIKSNLIQNKIGYTYQLSISDWELLENFKNFINQIDGEYIENNSKLDYMSEIGEQIQDFCEDNFDGYTLKIQTK